MEWREDDPFLQQLRRPRAMLVAATLYALLAYALLFLLPIPSALAIAFLVGLAALYVGLILYGYRLVYLLRQ